MLIDTACSLQAKCAHYVLQVAAIGPWRRMSLTFQTRSPTAEGSQNQPGLLVSLSDRRCAFCTYSPNRLPFFSVCSPLRIASPQISVLMGPARM